MTASDHYNDTTIKFLGDFWGDGYMSPGGPKEVARVLEGLDLNDFSVLDIGCGSGQITIELVQQHGAKHVTGIDVEDTVVAATNKRVSDLDLTKNIEIRKVNPGPLPFDDNTFDLVFSKDSIIHIPDKEALAIEAFRVTQSGGYFAAADWLISHDGEPSKEMAEYISAEDLDFAMASPARYQAAMEKAGFINVQLTSRNAWYSEVASEELKRFIGHERESWDIKFGKDFMSEQEEIWEKLVFVLVSGEHCPHHIRAQKPG
ncbi:MAG: SAM-dependent methyltransferase [Rhodobacteraceae bacterium]|nr:SAM-dependent methyltransferase [Paracoccaceae bacterium]